MSATEAPQFRIAVTADFHDERGEPRYQDIGLGEFTGISQIVTRGFSKHLAEISAEQLHGFHAALVLTPRVTVGSLEGNDQLLAIARFGVGYDTVDVAACTERDILVTNTPGAVDRPVAEATVGWMLALTHRIAQKDRLVREGRWEERSQHMGTELRDRILGIVGLGGIGRKLVSLLQGFGMRQPVAFDPFVSAEVFEQCGVRKVTLKELLETADFVSLHCPLTEDTRGLIGAEQLRQMKPSAWLLNLARGGIVDEMALDEALRSGRLAGAAVDCFENEPVIAAPPFAGLDNVLLAPHSIAWTHELFRDIGRSACGSLREISQGIRPATAVNPEVFDRPGFQRKWETVVDYLRG